MTTTMMMMMMIMMMMMMMMMVMMIMMIAQIRQKRPFFLQRHSEEHEKRGNPLSENRAYLFEGPLVPSGEILLSCENMT